MRTFMCMLAALTLLVSVGASAQDNGSANPPPPVNDTSRDTPRDTSDVNQQYQADHPTTPADDPPYGSGDSNSRNSGNGPSGSE